MNKNVRILTVVALMAVLFSSCNKTTTEPGTTPTPTPTPGPEAQVDYTILYYGCGGGNLDGGDEDTVMEMAQALPESDSNVRILVQYKYSSPKSRSYTVTGGDKNTLAGEAGHVYRYEVTPKVIAPKGSSQTLLLPSNAQYGNQNAQCELFQPDSIASFIKYAVKQAPAKDYILVFSGHGNGYSLYEDIPIATKSTVSDDNFDGDTAISMYQVKEGIKRSGVNIALLAFESCEMGQIEVVAELQNSAKYMMASGHSISGLGYPQFINALLDQEDFLVCCTEFAKASLNANLSGKGGNMNFAVTDFSKTAPFFEALKNITTYLCAHKVDNLNGYLAAAGKTYQFDQEDSKFDIIDYLYFLGSEVYSQDAEYLQLLNTVKETFLAAQPIHFNSLACKGNIFYDRLSYSITLGAQGYMAEYSDRGRKQVARASDGTTYRLINNVVGEELNTSADLAWSKTYNLTTFDKTVGWSKWFSVNPAFPRNNPPFYNFQNADQPIESK